MAVKLTIPRPTSRADERDTMFARMARMVGTEQHRDYYSRHPELKKKDDLIRSMPPLLSREGFAYDEALFSDAEHLFADIPQIEIDSALLDVQFRWLQSCDTPVKRARILKRIARKLGAVSVGIAPLLPAFIYSHKGRHDEDYGKPIELDHSSVMVFLVEMDHGKMQRAPLAESIHESATQYHHAARIATHLQALLSRAGHGAKAHYDAHYDVILPPLAVHAGLGELGRNNILIAPRYGARVRIGAVSTSLELPCDQPTSYGVDAFCTVCGKCAKTCPPRALTKGKKSTILGVKKWPTKVESCYTYWRRMGTDCGVCMAVCPFSHKNSPLHNSVRALICHTTLFNKLLVRLDDLVYGRSWKPGKR
ncbi:4Fe-4S dicluster domain-containing protein [bacterium]|nr:4Fe-4S dicluster domain-containing protein [bacterium]